jgi:hypothetical protein
MRWGRIVIGGLLTEAIIIAGFLALLFATRLAGAPTIALPETPLDFANAIVSSFAVTLAAAIWVCRRVESSHVLHGVLVGVVAIAIFVLLTQARPEPLLYVLAHGLKIAGGATGGYIVKRQRLARVASVRTDGVPVISWNRGNRE